MTVYPLFAPGSAAAASPDNALSKLSGDYTMFLRLLTSQMQNQDPLDPMDTSQYTQQLVQYAQVEQSIQQTGALKDIVARLSGQDMITASALIGREARYAGAQAGLTASRPAQWQWQLDREPASLVATISDASGRVVDTRRLDPSATALSWDGLLETGSLAPAGTYSLSLDARDAEGNVIAPEISAIGRVEVVSQQDEAITLTISGVPVGTDALRDLALPRDN